MFKKMIIVAVMALLAISTQAGTARAALVNGGFETGDFAGWTLTNVTADDFVFVANTGTQYEGAYEALLGKSGAVGTISQAFSTAIGDQYTVSFWLKSEGLSSTNLFQVLWNGQSQALNPVLNPNLASPYTQYSFSSTATSNASVVAFDFQNDPSVYGLDNVTVTPIPAAAWLFGSGLLGLVGIRRRKG